MKSGWQRTTLGAAFKTVTGTTPPKNNSDLYGQFMPLVKPPELCDATLDSSEDGLSEAGAKVARTLPPNSILVSCIGNLGKIGLNTVSVAFNQQINAIWPDEGKVIPKFMFYQALSSSFKEQLEVLASGTTVPIVNKSKFNNIEIVLPPLPEQQRIVGILDEAFDGIAAAKTTAEKNLQNARALFASHLQAVFTQRGEGWQKIRLGDMVKRLTNGYVGPTRNIYCDTGIPYLLARHVKRNSLIFDGKTFVTELFNMKHRKSILKAGDVLLVQSGHIGHSAVVPREHEGHNCHAMIVITPIDDKLTGKFLSWYFESPSMQKGFEDMRTGSTIKHLNCGDVIELTIPTPDLTEQRAIVEEVESIRGETQRLESIYQQKLTALEALKKSLLHQAFTGNL